MKQENEGVTVLIAEDDDGHALLVQQRLESAGVNNPVLRFRDGQEAWEFLSGADAETGKNCLLLLDIRMPRLDGIEVLRRIKNEPRLKNLPVIMLTTTDDPREIGRCRELGCDNYLVKPVEFDNFAEALKRLGLFLLMVRVKGAAE